MILNTVLDAGIYYINTSIDYGVSEERIGPYMGHWRRLLPREQMWLPCRRATDIAGSAQRACFSLDDVIA